MPTSSRSDHQEVHGDDDHEQHAQGGIVPHVAQAGADGGDHASIRAGLLLGCEAPHPQELQREQRDDERAGIDRQGHPDTGEVVAGAGQAGDQHAGQRRRQELGHLFEPQDDRVRGLEPLSTGDLRHDRVLGRVEEAVAEAEEESEDEQRPDVDRAQEGDRGERAHRRETGGVGRHHHAARREAIGDRAADQHEERTRHVLDGKDGAQHDQVARHRKDEPGERDQQELVAEERDALAGDQQAKVAQPEHPEQARAGRPAALLLLPAYALLWLRAHMAVVTRTTLSHAPWCRRDGRSPSGSVVHPAPGAIVPTVARYLPTARYCWTFSSQSTIAIFCGHSSSQARHCVQASARSDSLSHP